MSTRHRRDAAGPDQDPVGIAGASGHRRGAGASPGRRAAFGGYGVVSVKVSVAVPSTSTVEIAVVRTE